MRICASLSGPSDIASSEDADMVEVRTDIFDSVPEIKGKETLVTFRNGTDLDILPDGFSGIVDIGTDPEPPSGLRTMSSRHDYDATPDAERIRSLLRGSRCDIVKGAFAVNDFRDLISILDAARSMERRHVVLGMGPLGTVTRIRQSVLGNEFTFAYVGEPTAPGQMSLGEMAAFTDDTMVTGLVGNPVTKSKSPLMHNTAFKFCGIDGIYLPFGSPDLDLVEEAVVGYGIRGVNVTIPYKQEIMDHVDAVDRNASAIGAVNPVVNNTGRLEGYNTDVVGIETALSEAGFEAEDRRVLIMGSGGAAKACAWYMTEHGCDVMITGRNRDTGEELAKEFGCSYRVPSSVSVKMHDLIVNCTPVGMYSDGPYPINISSITRGQAVFDMVYGRRTPLVMQAEERGCRVADGRDMLAGQGAASFGMWTGRDDVFAVMRRALV